MASFGYDTCAVDFSYNSIIAALPCALTELQKRMTNPFRVLSWSTESRLAMACANQFKAACTTILQDMRTRGCHNPSDLSVGAQLLKVVDPQTGSQLSDAQLTAEIGTFLMGGFETTAHTLSFTVFCIANNLEVQDRITAELTSLGLLRGHDGKSESRGLQYEDLPKLSYLDSVLKESMRMFPVVAGFPRLCAQPTQIGQHIVPKGFFVYVLFHALHNSGRYWKDPDQFQPDRWTGKSTE
ncbi:probable cytochrome P450 4V2 [Coccomyxa sp. Obi]|nr:probable cytochrome P450 4V2 [Coccomyxa sp. Obi]